MLQRLIPMLTTTGRPHGVERLYSVRQCVQKSSLAETQLRIGIGSHRLFSNRYKGYVFPGQIVMSGIFKELPNFQFKPEDVIVASYPKTGTTWVQEIVYMLTHSLEKSDDSSEVLETRFPYLEYPYPGIKSIGAKTGPRYVKTHLPITLLPSSFENSNAKLIYIARNPRDTAVSYFYFLRLLTQCSYEGTLSSFIKMFLSDMAVYSPFFDHVLGYWKSREDPSILFITYEELHQDSIKVIKKIAEFLEVEVSDYAVNYIAACTSFSAMAANPSVNYEHWKDLGFAHKDKGQFMRKGQVGSWEVHLNKEEVAAFEEWENRHLKDSDLRFIFTLPAKQVEG
ncbi:sulfotransferase family cytosolic 1B member 1-like isoform X2 [Homarus americanus]|uniref:sulfotransferase family cytosolic 1B member 1-like isoform X2 n=1 Tax=Homarus americanus TaxID=6706 RepID=UPI001C44E3F6|nr:sulfotransferase family cytosolic 1B member 1-like isoform X2 [Homarus americanus]